MTIAKSWWDRGIHADRRPFLEARGRIKTAIRSHFLGSDFTEVECPALQVSPGNEAHLHGFATDLIGPDGVPQRRYLHTSPEFTMKKVIAAGETRIFEFARVFRNRERTALHHPEFTMLEWYRVGEPYEALMQDCTAFLMIAAECAGSRSLRFRDRRCDPGAEPERLTVAGAFDRHAGIDLLATLDAAGGADVAALKVQAEAAGVRTAADDTWSDVFSRVLAEKVEPRLGDGCATILCEYPTHEAALARACRHDARVAERFELYACGVELANAFGELTDPVEQRARFEAEMDEKARVYGERYPIDEDFLAALVAMPEACGAALGFDRLVMLATGASRIEQVIWAPVAE
ncbi:MAG: EF-P lysine aminoacylase EpmA [Ancalomicrobiaceae bacterium]|nr:EF-P lysine aminoacylase EpmA [Ancalomicrobiaceae bacterium]